MSRKTVLGNGSKERLRGSSAPVPLTKVATSDYTGRSTKNTGRPSPRTRAQS